jgi:hypothetical protein
MGYRAFAKRDKQIFLKMECERNSSTSNSAPNWNRLNHGVFGRNSDQQYMLLVLCKVNSPAVPVMA